MDEKELRLFAAAWHSEMSREGQHEYLLEPSRHCYLGEVWERDEVRPHWLKSDSVDGLFLVDCIHLGSISTIFRAISSTGDAVCLKLPAYRDNHDPQTKEKLNKAIHREFDTLESLQDFGCRGQIPRSLSSGEIEHSGMALPYVVTEYLPCLTEMQTHIARLELPETLAFCQQVCDLTHALHLAGVIHGDIHSRNVFADKLGRPVLLDFGSSCFRSGVKRGSRDFMPHLSIHTREAEQPNEPLTTAFDVLCLAVLARNSIEPYFGVIPTYLEAAGGRSRSAQYARLIELHRQSTWFAPEYRPQHANTLSNAIGKIPTGPLEFRPPAMHVRLTVLLRQNRQLCLALCGVMLALAAIGYVYAGKAKAERSLRIERESANQQLNQLLVQSQRSNHQSLGALQDLLSYSRSAARTNAGLDPETVDVQSRIADRLFTILRDHKISSEVRTDCVSVCLQLARSILDVQGYDDIGDELLGQTEQHSREIEDSPARSLILAEVLALRIRENLEKHKSVNRHENIVGDSKEALKKICAVSPDNPLIAPGDYYRVAYSVGWDALYKQMFWDWTNRSNEHPLRTLFRKSLAPTENFPTRAAKFWRARLLALEALVLHKDRAMDVSTLAPVERAKKVRRKLLEAQTLLESIPRPPSSPSGFPTSSDIEALTGRIDSLFGLSLKGAEPLDFKRAEVHLKRALETREALANRFPGSLDLTSQAVAAGWNLADLYMQHALDAHTEEEQQHWAKLGIEARRGCVQLARRAASQDGTATRIRDYRVNCYRLCYSYYLVHDLRAIEHLVKDLDDTVGLKALSPADGMGHNALLALAVAYRMKLTQGLESPLREQAQDLHKKLVRIRSERSPDHVRIYRQVQKLIADDELFATFSETDWYTTLRLELADGIRDTNQSESTHDVESQP